MEPDELEQQMAKVTDVLAKTFRDFAQAVLTGKDKATQATQLPTPQTPAPAAAPQSAPLDVPLARHYVFQPAASAPVMTQAVVMAPTEYRARPNDLPTPVAPPKPSEAVRQELPQPVVAKPTTHQELPQPAVAAPPKPPEQPQAAPRFTALTPPAMAPSHPDPRVELPPLPVPDTWRADQQRAYDDARSVRESQEYEETMRQNMHSMFAQGNLDKLYRARAQELAHRQLRDANADYRRLDQLERAHELSRENVTDVNI